MQFKTKLICYYVPAHTSGVFKEAEKLWALPDFAKRFLWIAYSVCFS